MSVYESLNILVKADTSKAKSELSSLGGDLLKMGSIAAGISFFKKSIEDASDLTEASNLFDKTMGNSRKTIDTMVKKSADLGMAHGEMANYASQYAATLKGTGFDQKTIAEWSGKMLERQADAGSFYNKSNDEMNMKLKMAMTGSAEATQGLGKAMTINNLKAFEQNELHGKAYDSLSEQEKVLVRIKFFMEQTKTAAGDFKGSLSGSMENQLKKLKAQFLDIGSELAIKILPKIIKLMEWVSKNINTVKNMGIMFATWKLSKEFLGGLGTMQNAISINSSKGGATLGKVGNVAGKGVKALGGVAGVAASNQVGGWSGLLGGAMSGASAGSVAGPWGTVAGGLIGAGIGGWDLIKSSLHLDGKEVAANTSKHKKGKSGNNTGSK